MEVSRPLTDALKALSDDIEKRIRRRWRISSRSASLDGAEYGASRALVLAADDGDETGVDVSDVDVLLAAMALPFNCAVGVVGAALLLDALANDFAVVDEDEDDDVGLGVVEALEEAKGVAEVTSSNESAIALRSRAASSSSSSASSTVADVVADVDVVDSGSAIGVIVLLSLVVVVLLSSSCSTPLGSTSAAFN